MIHTRIPVLAATTVCAALWCAVSYCASIFALVTAMSTASYVLSIHGVDIPGSTIASLPSRGTEYSVPNN
jgi:hypothetical protein